jgi:sugar phosphate isomerase/epimerase
VTDRAFGISTHLFHEHRLTRDHLVHIAAHGFEAIEVFATRAHFDYHDGRAIDELASWLTDTRLALHSVHAPAFDALTGGRWVGSYSNASGDETRRRAALAETAAALAIARTIPFRYLVVHLGMPTVEQVPTNDASTDSASPRASSKGDNQPAAARRSVEEIAAMAAEAGVQVAMEVIPNPLSSAAALSQMIEDDLEGTNVGICLDYGHAHLMGDIGDAVEAVSGHLWTTHVHDNHRKRDEHLVPFAGSIDWAAAMMATQKIGYDGALILEVGDTGDPVDVLRRGAKARERLEKMFVTF